MTFANLFRPKRFISISRLLAILFVTSCSPGGKPPDPLSQDSYVSFHNGSDYFTLSGSGNIAPIYISDSDYAGVIRAVRDLKSDLGKVTGLEPEIFRDSIPGEKEIVIIGTVGKNKLLDRLSFEKKIDLSGITGQWESFLIQSVHNPLPGVDEALIIAGSDKRGTIYGIYDLSREIGVSPWYWWADVPAKKHPDLFIIPGAHPSGEPAVKYRGIFINDEAPALSGWADEKFGGFNHKFYAKVFELILRLKGNFLWPAMWGHAFYDDDSLNAPLADEYGIVIGTSHHEPMMRAHVEWERYGKGPWNYPKNEQRLKAFWKKGIERMKDYESIVTAGMRGDGDKPMAADVEINVLKNIISDQRKILENVTGRKPAEIPQAWALYKEVQEYYDQGMRVPDDITLLFSDDNWGNIRRLPDLKDSTRRGGFGIYYHFDYVGDPRNYKWVNTNQIERVWEQMHLAYEYHARRIWIVNVGDIKPMEFPISFFLDYAWNPEKWSADRLPDYYLKWSKEQFGEKYAVDIAGIVEKYTKYNSRRKPELLSPKTYSLHNYREAQRVVDDYNALAARADSIYQEINPEYKDAFYQLVLFPVKACANLNEMFVTAALNRLYAAQGRATTNELAEKVKSLFQKDSALSAYFEKEVAKGKWVHMMSQTHIGYTYWQQPEKNTMPEVKEIKLKDDAEMGIAVEGSDRWWTGSRSETLRSEGDHSEKLSPGGDAVEMPGFNPYGDREHYFEIFNRGRKAFDFTIAKSDPWLHFSAEKGTVTSQQQVWVSISPEDIPQGKIKTNFTIKGPKGSVVTVQVSLNNPEIPTPEKVHGYIEGNGYITMEGFACDSSISSEKNYWDVIYNLGRTGSAITPMPVLSGPVTPGGDSPRLEYNIYVFDTGSVTVSTYLSPTLDFKDNGGLRFGLSLDNDPPEIINMHSDSTAQPWGVQVSNNISVIRSRLHILKPGEHVLKYWMVDPAVDLQKIVLDFGGVQPGYLGPPPSYRE